MLPCKEFFAGANTCAGFVSFFENITKDCEKVYIVKGAPGCGKSTFIRKCGAFAEKSGLECAYIRCSADPASYDGVYIPSIKAVVLDGTPPHTYFEKYPSAKEIVIDPSRFWNEKTIFEKSRTIIEKTDAKAGCFANASRALKAANELLLLIRADALQALDFCAMRERAMTIANRLMPIDEEAQIRLCAAFTRNGIFALDSFQNAKKVRLVTDFCYCAPVFLQIVFEECKKKGINPVVSYSPYDGKSINALYFPQNSMLYISEGLYAGCQNISVRRLDISTFFNGEQLSQSKKKRLFLKKLLSGAEKTARIFLSTAFEYHKSIEEIYTQAMDFDAFNDYTEKFLKGFLS